MCFRLLSTAMGWYFYSLAQNRHMYCKKILSHAHKGLKRCLKPLQELGQKYALKMYNTKEEIITNMKNKK